MKKLTLQTLREHDACKEEVKLFIEHFGEEVLVTEKLCASVSDEFNWDWAAEYLLSPVRRIEFDLASDIIVKEFSIAKSPFVEEYIRESSDVRKQYPPTLSSVDRGSLSVAILTVRNKYDLATAPYQKKYNLEIAQLWARLYIQS
jgi:hypothetical protein